MAAALLQRRAGKGVEIPAWLLFGFGRATSYRIAPKDAVVKKEHVLAAKWAPNWTSADVWGGKLNADEAPILEASLADYLAYGPPSAKFPKFVTGTVAVDGVTTPKTEIELGAVCPNGVICPEHQFGRMARQRSHRSPGAARQQVVRDRIPQEDRRRRPHH